MKNEQESKNNLEKGTAYFSAVVQIGEYIYYSAKYANGLFRANLTTRKSEFITMFETEREGDVHNFAFTVNDEIWFIPAYLGDRIAIFNIKTLKMEYLDIPEPKKTCNGFLFMNSIIKGDFVWLVPGVYDAFLCLDINNRKIRKVDLPISDYGEMGYSVIQGYEYDNKIYLCPWDYNRVLYLDLASEEIGTIDVIIKENVYRNIIVIDNHIYLFPREIPNDILEIDLIENKCFNRTIDVGNVSTLIVAAYYDICKKRMLLFPRLREKRVYVLNMENFEVTQIDIEVDNDWNFSELIFWRDIAKISDDTFFVIPNDNSAPILEYHKNKLKPFLLECQRDLFVRQLLDLIEKEEDKRKQMKGQENIGEKIYKVISSDTP